VELGKQRENKLMFFLYVLKEEKKCPVTEVFENYIKPIETQRFTTDYGEDYKRVLKKIKKQFKYEKIYNRAIKKMRLLSNHKEYKSDSCIPIGLLDKEDDPNARKRQTDQIRIARSLSNYNKRAIIRIRNRNGTVKLPTLNIMQLGTGYKNMT